MIKKIADHHGEQHDETSTDGPPQPVPNFSASLADLDVESLAIIAAGLAKFLTSIPNGLITQIALGFTSELSARIAGASSVGLVFSVEERSKMEILDAMVLVDKVTCAFVAKEAPNALLKNIGRALEQELFRRWQLNQDLPAQVAGAERLN
jgi:hypothetical protein